jgi:hypothetical protein
MEFENWRQIVIVALGLVILWGVIGLILKLAQRVISCGCGLILAAAAVYLLLSWIGIV